MSKGNEQTFICIYSNDTFDVYYDKDTKRYHIDVFDDGHYWDKVWFDAYEAIDANEEKEIDNKVEKIVNKLTSIKEEILRKNLIFDEIGVRYFINTLINWINGL